MHYQEIALYKMAKKNLSSNPEILTVIANHGAKILPTELDYEYFILEKTGHKNEIMNLFNDLEVYGVSEFVKSARISVSKSKRETRTLIEQLENSNFNLIDA